jgi:tetratricopeptide (TPR) repeat protein
MSVSFARPCRVMLAALLLACGPMGAFAQQNASKTPPPAPPAGGNSARASAPPNITPEVRKALAQFQAAEQLRKQGKSKEAIAAYQEFLRLADAAKMGEGAQVPAFGALYEIYRIRQDTQGMETALQRMVKVTPQDPRVWVAFASLYLQEKKFSEAVSSADKALTLKSDPQLAGQAHLVRGTVAFLHKQWAEAEAEYAAVIKVVPDNPEWLSKLLLAQNAQHKTRPAITTAERLLKVAPRMTPVRLLLAQLKEQNKDPLGALATYADALKIEPNNAAVLFNRALLLQRMQKWDEAVSAYSAYLALAPKDFNAQYNVGLLYQSLRNVVAARKHFAAAAQINPKSKAALFNLAMCEREAGFAAPTPRDRADTLSAAITHFKQAIALDPKDRILQNQLAALYERDGRFQETLAIFQQQQQADPDNPEPYRLIAHLSIAMREPDRGIAEWRKYRSRKPGDPASYGEVADLLEAEGKWKEASEERLLQIQHDPKDGQAKLDLAREYRQLKQPENAETEYKLILDADVTGKDAGEKERPYVAASRRNWRMRAWRGLSELSDAAGKTQEAIDYLQNVQQEETNLAKQAQQQPPEQTFVDIANLYERSKQIDLARKELKALTEARPDDDTAFAALAEFELRQGRVAEAVFAYNRAEERAKDPIAYGLKAALAYQKQNQLDKAIAEYTRLVNKYPNEPRVATPLAETLEQSHDDIHALALYNAQLKMQPDSVSLLDKKAGVLIRLKRYAEARAVREKIVDRQPTEYQAYANIGYLYELEGKPELYRQWLTARVAQSPTLLPAMAALVDAYVKQKQEEEGWKVVRGIVQKHRDDVDVQETFVSVLSQHKHLSEAIEIRRQIARQNPKDLEMQTRLADLLIADGQKDEADKWLSAYVERADIPIQTRLQARRILAKQLGAEGKNTEAIVQYQRIVQADLNDLSSVISLGRLLVQSGRDDDAARLYSDQVKRENVPPFVIAHFLTLIGDIYVKQGRKSEAKAQYEKALRLNPQNKDAALGMQRLASAK